MSSTEGRNHPSDSHALVNRSGARRPSIFSRIRRDSLSARDTTIHFEFQGIVDSSMRHGNQVHGVAVDCSAQRCSDSFLDSRPSAGLLTPLEKRQQLTTSLLKPPDRRNELHVSHHAQPPQRSDRPTHSPIMHHRIRQLRGNCSQDVSVLSLPNSPAYTKFSTSMKQSDANNNQSILSEGAICRICHEGDADERLVSPCYCSGSLGMLHLSCLERWLDASNTTKCEICLFQFIVERRPHPVKWYLKNSMLETERKNLYCDAICLSLFAPITIICTTLCLLGARYFSSVGKTEIETCLIIVCVLNLTMFGVWCLFAIRKNCQRCKYWRNHYQVVRIKHCHLEKPKSQPVSKKMLSFRSDPLPSKASTSTMCGSMGSLSRISECAALSDSEEDIETVDGKHERNYQTSEEAVDPPLTVAVNTVVISDPVNSYPRVLLLNYTTSTPKTNSVFNFHTTNESRKNFFRGMETNV